MEGGIQAWLDQVSNPNFPWRTQEDSVDYGEESDDDDDDVLTKEAPPDPLMVDPLQGWQHCIIKVCRRNDIFLSRMPGGGRKEGSWGAARG